MTCWEIAGGQPLQGKVTVQGSKNAVLPILAGALLQKGMTVLHNCPRISDVLCMLQILEALGCRIQWERNTVWIDAANADGIQVPMALGEKMRSSVILLGSLLGRSQRAVLPYPGGCTIGKRPIDFHIETLQKMGAEFEICKDHLEARTKQLVGQKVYLAFPSVGATENIILAAVLSKGETIINGAAREPEIVELCRFLRGKGARICGDGTERICIMGVSKLHDSEYTLVSDRIVAGTYLFGATLTRGRIFLEKAPAQQLLAVLEILGKMGAFFKVCPDGIWIDGRKAVKAVPFVKTETYPGFPTDLQSQLMAALLTADGESEIEETIFEERFQVVKEFKRMGANIIINGKNARIRGVAVLHGTEVKAQELRGGAALVLAALGAEGRTIVRDDGYIRRGYEDLAKDLKALGAEICVREYGG